MTVEEFIKELKEEGFSEKDIKEMVKDLADEIFV